jgi:DNA-binding response OmpR family regulator
MAQNGVARVLCVENDEDSCAVLKRYLETQDPGLEVVGVGSAEEAQQKVLGEKFDLYILDHWLDGMSGVEFCRWIRQRERDVPIVFFSAVAYEAERQKGLDAGAQEYLIKPNDLERLPSVVGSLLHRVDDPTEEKK